MTRTRARAGAGRRRAAAEVPGALARPGPARGPAAPPARPPAGPPRVPPGPGARGGGGAGRRAGSGRVRVGAGDPCCGGSATERAQQALGGGPGGGVEVGCEEVDCEAEWEAAVAPQPAGAGADAVDALAPGAAGAGQGGAFVAAASAAADGPAGELGGGGGAGAAAGAGGAAVVGALARLLGFLGVAQVSAALRAQAVRLLPVCAASLVVAAVAGWWAAVGARAGAGVALELQRWCTAAVFFLMGVPALEDLLYNIAMLDVNIHVLTMLAVFGTIFLGRPLEGALLLLLFEAATLIEAKLTVAAKGDLQSLVDSAPSEAAVVTMLPSGLPDLASVEERPTSELAVGTFMLVKAGEHVPLDGRVAYGDAQVSMQHITGEALPVSKGPGDALPAGAQNHDGVLVIESTKVATESTPATIARLTAAAQANRPVLQNRLLKYKTPYSKLVLLCSAVVAAGLPALGVPVLGPQGSIYRAAVFLTAAAPCALVMSPMPYVAAIAVLSRRGVLIRGGKILDALGVCRTVALDKTGTLTTGNLVCSEIFPLAGDGGGAPRGTDLEALAVAAALSRRGNHPVSKAVVTRADALERRGALGVRPVDIDGYKVIPGSGVEGVATGGARGLAGVPVRFGSVPYIASLLPEGPAARVTATVAARGGSQTFSALLIGDPDGAGAAAPDVRFFQFSDKVRSKSQAAVERIRGAAWRRRRGRLGPAGGAGKDAIDVMMLTGDNAQSAEKVARAMAIDLVHAGLSPEAKLKLVERARGRGKGSIVMVGDGINDAPALASADVGVAIAPTPNAAAASAADVILLSERENISALPYVLEVAEKTKALLTQNVVLAGVSILGTALPAIWGVVPLWAAVLMHEGSTLLVALNSLRMLIPPAEDRDRVAVLAAAAVVCSLVAGISLAVVYSFGGSTHPAVMETLKGGWAGLIAGTLHTLTGPDHLAALAPLSVGRSKVQGILLGGIWGMGHNSGQIIFAALFLLLKNKLDLDMGLIEAFGTTAVGVTLCIIGLIGLVESRNVGKEAAGADGGPGGEVADAKFNLATFATGLVHGLQPDSLFLILPAFAMASKFAATAFLAAFLTGTVLAMASYTAFLSYGSTVIGRKSPWFNQAVSFGSSLVALAIGVALIFGHFLGLQIGLH